ncbi:MAG: hypothetical protein HKN62_19155, partial [Phycisphaerales bacterium]|nr:hypothetical protein [Phycisphaerales bacterium]
MAADGPSGAEQATFCFRFRLAGGIPTWDAAWTWENHFSLRLSPDAAWCRVWNEDATGVAAESLDTQEIPSAFDGQWHSVVVILKTPLYEVWVDGVLHDTDTTFRGLRHAPRADPVFIGSDGADGPVFHWLDVGVWSGAWDDATVTRFFQNETVANIASTMSVPLAAGWTLGDTNYDEAFQGGLAVSDVDLQDRSDHAYHLGEFPDAGLPTWKNDFPAGWPHGARTWVVHRTEAAIVTRSQSGRVPLRTDPVTLRTHNLDHAIGGTGSPVGTPPTDAAYDNHRTAIAEIIQRDRPAILCVQELYDHDLLEHLNESLPPEQRYSFVACTASTISHKGTPGNYVLYDFRNATPTEPRPADHVRNLSAYDGSGATLRGPGHAGIVRWPWRFECGVLSDYEILESREIEWRTRRTVLADGETYPDDAIHKFARGALCVKLDVNSTNLYLGVVHLPGGHADPARTLRGDGMTFVIDTLKSMVADDGGDTWETASVVVCGDLNGRASGMIIWHTVPDVTTGNQNEWQAPLEAAGFHNTWNEVQSHSNPAVTPNRYTRYSFGDGETLDYIYVKGLPHNDAIVAVRVNDSGAPDYEESMSGEPGVVSDHWAPQIDTGLVAPPG